MTATMLDIIKARAERISQEVVRLLEDFSGMHPANKGNDVVVIINLSGDHYWNNLPPDGKKIQAALLPEVDRFGELVLSLSQNLPNKAQRDLSNTLQRIRNTIDQHGATSWGTKNEAVIGFRGLIAKVITTLENFCATSQDIALVIPDTNALLGNPDIEHWEFDGVAHFTIILTPTILSELDTHKINHKNEVVRSKATTLIRKIKEYRRRGSLLEGISVVKDRVSLRSIANEPNMSKTLSWFDVTNADDRFLATTLEIIRGNIGANTFIVTSDINMQNKAEMTGIPFHETPDAKAEKEQG